MRLIATQAAAIHQIPKLGVQLPAREGFRSSAFATEASALATGRVRPTGGHGGGGLGVFLFSLVGTLQAVLALHG
jgi:hypothetical protein